MQLELCNIGSFEYASVVINGITVIAGENATGKSTIGKALYSLFYGFKSYDKKIENKIKVNIARQINNVRTWEEEKEGTYSSSLSNVVDKIYQHKESYLKDSHNLLQELIKYYEREVLSGRYGVYQ